MLVNLVMPGNMDNASNPGNVGNVSNSDIQVRLLMLVIQVMLV